MGNESTEHVTHGYWLVAFLDLLGQKEAFMRTDYLPNAENPEKVEAFIAEVQASVGVVRGMRRLLDSFRTGLRGADHGELFADLPPDKREIVNRLRGTRVREYRISDGIVLACPLMPETGHFPIRGVYEIIATCAALMLVQLAAGRPIRGGLDVGTGMEVDNELFGASLVKAYVLESKRAKHPRIAVGQDLVNYLKISTKSPTAGLEGQFERSLATGMMNLLKRDSDNQWIIDYAGPKAHELILHAQPELLKAAKEFARRTRNEFQQRKDKQGQELFERYSKLVRYLDACGP